MVEEAKSWPVRVTQGVRRFRRGVSDWISSDTGAPRESYQLYTQRCNPKRMIQLGAATVTKVGGQAGWASKRMGGGGKWFFDYLASWVQKNPRTKQKQCLGVAEVASPLLFLATFFNSDFLGGVRVLVAQLSA